MNALKNFLATPEAKEGLQLEKFAQNEKDSKQLYKKGLGISILNGNILSEGKKWLLSDESISLAKTFGLDRLRVKDLHSGGLNIYGISETHYHRLIKIAGTSTKQLNAFMRLAEKANADELGKWLKNPTEYEQSLKQGKKARVKDSQTITAIEVIKDLKTGKKSLLVKGKTYDVDQSVAIIQAVYTGADVSKFIK